MVRRCVFFGKPLLESGTMGTKCNVQCVIPHVSINYDGRKDPDTKVPTRLLHHPDVQQKGLGSVNLSHPCCSCSRAEAFQCSSFSFTLRRALT